MLNWNICWHASEVEELDLFVKIKCLIKVIYWQTLIHCFEEISVCLSGTLLIITRSQNVVSLHLNREKRGLCRQ